MFKQVSKILVLSGLLFLSAQVAKAEEVMLKQSFHDADIVSVIEAVSKLTAKNFIIDPRVKGNVTLIAPEPMPAESLYETLLLILKVHGFVAIPGESAIRIVPANTARDQLPFAEGGDSTSENWVTEVLTIKNVSASKLVAVLRPLVAREGHLVALSDSNKLILTDTQANILRIKAILNTVDVNDAISYEIITLKNASAEEMVRTIKSIIPKTTDGSPLVVNFDERSNRIILSGDSQERLKLRTLIADLDVPIPSVGRVQVVYLHYAKAKDLVPILKKIATNQSLLNSAASDAGTAGQANLAAAPATQPAQGGTASATDTQLDSKTAKDRIGIEADERMNAIVITAPPQVLSALKGVIKQLDVRRAQVLIEAILVEVSQSKQAKLGVEWGLMGNSGIGQINFTGAIATLAGAAANPAAAAAAMGTGASLAAGDLTGSRGWGALLSALSGDSESNILSTPTLLTLDNEEAEIVVGKEVPFQTGSYTATTTSVSNPFSTIERKNVGLKLKVKPQINEGNAIFLEIDQEVSDVLPKSDAVDLETSKRQIRTKIIVGDGDVIVLGGLLSEKESDVTQKVPGLGDIPWLGNLFSYQSKQREKVNLMVFLRTVIVRDNAMSNFYSQKKYTHLLSEQEALLQRKDDVLIKGLRPHLPTLEQWQNGEAATPYSGESTLPAEEVPVIKVLPPKDTNNQPDTTPAVAPAQQP